TSKEIAETPSSCVLRRLHRRFAFSRRLRRQQFRFTDKDKVALRTPVHGLIVAPNQAVVITENLVCMPTLSAEENDRGGLEVAERRVLDRKAGSAKRNPVSAREEIALVNTTNGSYSRRSAD